MNKTRFALNCSVVAGAALLCFGGACTSLDLSAVLTSLVPPDEAGVLESLSPELAFVADNKERFVSDLSDPLFDVLPGTVMDNIADLDGCWGSAIFSDIQLGSKPLVASYFVHKFDAGTGEYTLWVLADQLGVTASDERAGAFSVESDRRIETRTPDAKSYLIIRRGDQMRVHFGPADRGRMDPGDDELYTRFDCPE